jgi:Mg-chelatase subunit ChlD
MATSMRELARSLESLPDYAEFYIVLFSTNFIEPPMQKGWTRARKSAVRQVVRWLSQLDPNGGTQPRPAFLQVFSLTVRPDVIFFMTDGQVQEFTAEECATLNDRGKKSVINTIAFGDPSSQDLLKEIARQSGGLYRFVPSSGSNP